MKYKGRLQLFRVVPKQVSVQLEKNAKQSNSLRVRLSIPGAAGQNLVSKLEGGSQWIRDLLLGRI